jgi:hypothetical protein
MRQNHLEGFCWSLATDVLGALFGAEAKESGELSGMAERRLRFGTDVCQLVAGGRAGFHCGLEGN